jgi:drug/metabolite transporter (DMT)-like permease
MSPIAAIFLASFLWSTSFPLIKVILHEATPVDVLFYRFFFALLFSLPFWVLKKESNKKILLSPLVILLGLMNGFAFLLQFWAQTLTLATKTAFFINLYVVFVAIIDSFFGIRLRGREVAGVLLAISGSLLLTSEGNLSFLRSGSFRGDLLATFAAVIWGVYIFLTKRLMENLDPFSLMAAVVTWTFIFSVPIYLSSSPGKIPTLTLLELLYLGIFCSLLPYFLFNYAIKMLSATRTSLFLLVEVILAAFWSFIFLKESLNLWGILGGSLILLGVSLGNL